MISYNLLKEYLKGTPFIILYSIIYNELSLIIKNILVNIKVGKYIFINIRLA